MISVVVATYNGEKFITEQLNSIKNQNCQPDEVIIRDDRSSDATAEIVRKYIKENNLINWDFEINSENKGYKKNFYDLLKLAKGDLIFLSDQDDVWMNNKLAVMKNIMEQNKKIETLNSGIQLVDQNLKRIELGLRKNFYNANFIYSDHKLEELNYFKLEDMIERNISPGCSMCITKELRNQFITTYNFVLPHDWYMNLLASLNGNCCFVNMKLINYRIHQKNTIGLSTKWDIRTKLNSYEEDRKKRIKKFAELSESFQNIVDNYELEEEEKVRLQGYLKARLDFLITPNLYNLNKLRKFPEYLRSTTLRGKIWNLILSLHLDRFILN
ncbi:glycosyltransferase [Liquorilactobacillus mali]|uniref:glycosyltransferase n=1 Tax=Liquorilactobacillus mali TaxID=1618 RepID=UPI0026513404|nr:glycosyltransferase [Liquorilactobacillus mali]MDN7146274.1 glycosyltransferase [Liquorilactobacillus mali]